MFRFFFFTVYYYIKQVGGLFTVPQAAPDATSVLSGTLATVGFDGQVCVKLVCV